MIDLNYVYDAKHFSDILSELQERDIENNELSVKEVPNGLILPSIKSPVMQQVWGLGGVLNENNDFIIESASGAYDIKIFGGKYDYSQSEVVNYDEDVIFLGPITSHWGSFLVDQTARLWYLVKNHCNLRIAYCGVEYPENTFGDIERPVTQFMELLGLSRDRFIDIRKPSRFSNIIIPQLSFVQGKFISQAYKDIFQKASANVWFDNKEIYDKVYLTRTAINQKKEFGEKILESIFQANGYHVISMEKLSVAEQVFYMKTCKEIVSLDGTVAHNVLFSQNCEKQVVLEKQSRINPYQHWFNRLMGVPLVLVDVYREPYKRYPLNHDDGPFWVYDSKKLKDYLLDHRMTNPQRSWIKNKVKDWFGYTRKCIYLGRIKPVLLPLYHNHFIREIYIKVRGR